MSAEHEIRTSLPLSQQAVPALAVASFRHADAVVRAVGFIQALQPAGNYIVSRPGVDDIVPMDLTHAALALTKAGHQAEARAALDWLLACQTRPDDPASIVAIQGTAVDYTGSWYDHYDSHGHARRHLTRGRGEEVGLALIAVAALAQEDATYPHHAVAGESVLACIARAVRYLCSPAVQQPDGRFHHRPDYPVSFHEEAARMIVGLELAAALLADDGDTSLAQTAREHAHRGHMALARGHGLHHGMAYDYFARTLWSLASEQEARHELARLRAAGLAHPDGVRHYDWQSRQARTPTERLRWWLRGQVIAPAETFDWGIANIVAGQLGVAIVLEAAWLPRQRRDGGFAGGYFAAPRLPFGAPTSYAAARFILFQRLLTAATALAANTP